MIKNITDLEKSLKLKEGTLTEAIKSEDEVEVPISELVIRTKEEEESRNTNLKSESRTVGIEMAVKKVRTDLGLEFTGKTAENLAEAVKIKTLEDAKIEPDKKILDLEKDKADLQKNIVGLGQDLEKQKSLFVAEKNTRKIDEQILKSINKETTIPKANILTLFKAEYGTALNDKEVVEISKHGEVLKDKTTLNTKSIDEIMTDYLTPYLKKAGGGAGEGDDPKNKGKAGTMEAFIETQEKLGNKPGTEKFNREMQSAISDKTLKV
ncbi:MAG: hypothetical protein ACUZ8H_16040 [Candidatus Anammoxibacter sp.]